MDFHANRTLEDIKEYDRFNLENLLEKSKEYKFKDITSVLKFSGECMNAACMKHGINLAVAEAMSKAQDYEDVGHSVDKMMGEINMRVEPRMAYEGIDRWRCGVYIYKDNEITDFIGAPMHIEALVLSKYKYVIRTTVVLS